MEISALADLLDVQALDLTIDRLLAERSGLAELARYKAAHELEADLSKQIEAAAAGLREIELATDKAEGELELLEMKLTEHETRLFAGGMSGRETEHMRLEVESLRGQRGASEERVLSLLEDLDPARAAVKALQDEKTAVEAERDQLEEAIKVEWRRIDAEVARKEARKSEAIAPIPPDLLDMYDRLRVTKEGVAVGQLVDGTCGGCHMRLSPAEVVEATKMDPPRCVHCRRILVP